MKAIFKYNHRRLRQHDVMDQNFACLGSRSSGGGAGAFDVSPVPHALRTGRTGPPWPRVSAQEEVNVRIIAGSGSPLDRFCSKSSSGPGRGRSKPGRDGPFKRSNLLFTTCVLEYDHCLFFFLFSKI